MTIADSTDLDLADWRTAGICTQTDAETWYPEKGQRADTAKRLCAHCPVIDDCLQWALDTDERYGVWGGLNPRERREMIRRRIENP